MADIKNLTVEAGGKNILKVAEVENLCFIPRDLEDPMMIIIEASNGCWRYKLDDITSIRFDIVSDTRSIHIYCIEETKKDAEIQ